MVVGTPRAIRADRIVFSSSRQLRGRVIYAGETLVGVEIDGAVVQLPRADLTVIDWSHREAEDQAKRARKPKRRRK